MEYEGLPFIDALEKLASRLGLTIPKDAQESAKAQVKLSTTAVLNRVAEFYSAQLKHHPGASHAVHYLKARGLTGTVAKAFGLGFAPAGWDNLLSHFQNDSEVLQVLEQTGLIIKHEQGRFYDRFRQRIMFPIRNRKGEVLGFGGRVIDDSQPKYLNSPESPIFQKGYCLYGIYEALKSRQKWKSALVVEGYLDVIALAQFGIMGALATLGTAMTVHHLTSLFQLVDDVVFCFDGDKAGQAAAWKALQLVLPLLVQPRQVRFVFLPQGTDPDTYVRQQGAAAFLALTENSTPLSEYFFSILSQQTPLDSVDNRARFANTARTFIAQIPDGIFKEMMFEQLAQLAASSVEVVRGEKSFRSFSSRGWKKNKVLPPPQPLAPAFLASALLLRAPHLHALASAKRPLWQEITAPGIVLLNKIVDWINEQPSITGEALHQQLQGQNAELKHLADCENRIMLLSDEGLEAEFLGALDRLIVIGRKEVTEKLLQKSKTRELTPEEKQQLKEFLQYVESI